MSIHPVFYVGLLEQYRESTDPTRKQELPMPDEVDNEPSFVFEEILVSRWCYGSVLERVTRCMGASDSW